MEAGEGFTHTRRGKGKLTRFEFPQNKSLRPDERERKLYLKFVSYSSKVQDVLTYLDRLEDGHSCGPHLKDDIRTLRLMMDILIPFVGCISKWQTEHRFLEFRLDPVACVLENVIQEFDIFGRESIHLSEAEDLKPYSTAVRFVTSNLVTLRLMKPEMRKLYFVVSRSANPLAIGTGAEAVRSINSLLETLNDISCFNSGLIILLKEQIEALEEKLLFLRNFLGFLSEICILHEFLVDLLISAEALAVDAACVLYFVLVDNVMGEDNVQENKNDLLHVMEKIKPFQPDVKSNFVRALETSRSVTKGPFVTNAYALGFFDFLIHNLRELPNKAAKLKVASKDGIDSLLDKLNSVRCYLMDLPFHDFKEGVDNFMTELLNLIIDLGCFVCCNEEWESMEKFGDLLDRIQFIKSASGDLLIPRSWQSNFPATNELGFIDFILMNLRERLSFNIASTGHLKCPIDRVYEELVALRDDLGLIAELHKENEELRALFTHCKDVAYQAEYFVDLSTSGAESLQYQMLGLTDLRESIRQIHTKVKAISKEMSSDSLVQKIAHSPGGVSSEANPVSIDAVMGSKTEVGSKTDKAADQLVGLEDEIDEIIEQLIGGSEKLNIISIVGMPGIGKTTLANSVYGDPSVTLHFHARAWCSVSQVYQKENLLLEILHQVPRETKQDRGEHDKGFDQQLYQSLKGRRYLVILDDIWDIDVWDDLRLSFPDDNNGSRLLFTTRNHEVAFQANSIPHNLQLLSAEESWKLFQVKVFKEETCPLDLLKIGKKIAENCKGLPLAVVLIAGILKTTERNQDFWGSVAKRLSSYAVDYQRGQLLGILELSYMHLPDYLKPCFLYFGAFEEDAEIPAHKLVRFWIAEGFVQAPKVDQNSLEYEAENYLNDLIYRSLVIVAKRSSRGGVKACRIHDSLHEYCLVKAKEERFLLQIHRFGKLPTLRISEVHNQYRLSINSRSIPSFKMGNFPSRVRTLLLFCKFGASAWTLERRKQLNDIGFMDKFRLLRVLDLVAFRIDDENGFFTFTRLVLLRYLAIQAYFRKIPAEVVDLKNLETFILTGSRKSVSSETILSMGSLRHLCIGGNAVRFHFQVDNPKCFQKLSRLESLTTLSAPELCCDKDIEKMMRNLPNLQKLKCTFLDSWDPLKSFNHFPVLDFLNRLESLNVSFSGKGLYPCNLSFPSSLKKLTLSKSRLPWDEISIIGKLPKLEVLKLLEGAFQGREWDMKDGEFQELKFLKLCSLDIGIWNASREQLPCLEQLVLELCFSLEEIPSVLGEIPTLRRIDMKWCNRSAMHTVKQIEEEQQDMGNYRFNVLIS